MLVVSLDLANEELSMVAVRFAVVASMPCSGRNSSLLLSGWSSISIASLMMHSQYPVSGHQDHGHENQMYGMHHQGGNRDQAPT
jgi:hypothetical protein